MRLRKTIRILLCIGCVLFTFNTAWADDALERINNTTQYRRPISIQLDKDGSTLVVANRDSGSISLIDANSLSTTGEFELGKRLSCIEYLNSANLFVATDLEQHKVFCFQVDTAADKANVNLIWAKPTPQSPSVVRANSSETRFAIAGLWSRQIELVETEDWSSGRFKTSVTVDLDFCPGDCLWIANDRLLVADAFGDQFAIVQSTSKTVIPFRVQGHRTGGLSLSTDGQWVAFSDQRLNPLAQSTRNDVHWGLMVSNQLRWLPVSKLLTATASDELGDLTRAFSNQPIGRPEDAKADLGQLAIASNGTVAITVGGVDELAIGRQDDDGFAFVPVGRRPIAVVMSVDGERCFVANLFDDSISVVDLDDFELIETISLGQMPQPDLARKGERLFFDARLSHDGWMSCHSCHVEGHTNGMLNDNFSDQSFHTPKRVISLLGHGDTLPLAWTGGQVDFESQVRTSIESTMQSDEPATDMQVSAIADFIRRLPPPPAVNVARQRVDLEKLSNGKELFRTLDCIRCHTPPTYTTPETYEVGVRDENGELRFNPPSLIGLGQQDRYFHDGRYKKLQDLFTQNEHQLPRKLTDQEMSDLIVFLNSL